MSTLKIGGIIFCVALLIVAFLSMTDLSKIGGFTASVFASQQKNAYRECIQSFTDVEIQKLAVTTTDINTDGVRDAIITYTEGPQCGTAGCVTEICISSNQNTFTHLPFGLAVQSIQVKETLTNGMRDITLNDDSQMELTWNGEAYALTTN